MNTNKNELGQGSPTTTSAHADIGTDFRSPAVAASEAMRFHLPSGQSPERGGISCCLARQPSLSRLRTPIKVTTMVSAVLGFSGLAAGGILIFFQKGSASADSHNLLGIAAGCSFTGMLFMFLPTLFERWMVRTHLSEQAVEYGVQIRGIHIALEKAETYGSLKLLAEDVGLIYLHAGAHYVKISGLSYDYIVQSKDVVGLALHPNGKTVLLSYTVGNERLDLAILPRSLLAELKRQTLGSSRSLFVQIQEALKVQR